MPVNSFENYELTWKPKKNQLKTPYYRSLADLLQSDIQSGVLPGGTKLPPQRELADYLDIHFTTITRAYEECKRRNLIYGVAGSGTYVNPQAVMPITNSLDNLKKNQGMVTAETAIEMGFVSSFEETNSMVLDQMSSIWGQIEKKVDLSLRNPTGTEQQKESALKWMSQFGIHAPASQTAVVSGSMNGLTLCLLALFQPGARIAVEYYIYNNFIELTKLFNIHLIPIKTDEDGMIPEALEQACQQHSISGIYLMPSCSNPTTIHMPFARKIALAEVISKQALLLLEDDQYAFTAAGYRPDYIAPMRELLPEQTIYICNTTSSICSGLRVAFLVFPYRHLDAIYGAICNVNIKTSPIDTEIVCQLIESGYAKKISQTKVTFAQKANALFDDIFPDNAKRHPYSFFRWLEIPSRFCGRPVGWELLAQGVHVYHSRRFLCGKKEEPGYLRVALSSAGSMNNLKEGLTRIHDYFAS